MRMHRGEGSLNARRNAYQTAVARKVALIALVGVGTSLAIWLGVSLVESVFSSGRPLGVEIVSPTPLSVIVRLATILIVLVSTLIIQGVVTSRTRAQERLRLERVTTRALYENSPECIITVDKDLVVTYSNPAARSLDDVLSHGKAVGHACHANRQWDLVCEECPVKGVFTTGEVAQRAIRESAGGSERWVEQVAYPILDEQGRVHSVAMTIRDVSDYARSHKIISEMAFHDALTGLPNRMLFDDRLRVAVANAERRNERVMVACIDINDFKAINEAYGHGAGDRILYLVGARLVGMLRDEDTVSRQGADEFIVMGRIARDADAEMLADRLLNGMREPFDVEGHRITISASIGYSVFPEDGMEADEMVKAANAAMHRAKALGHHVALRYDSAMTTDASDRLELESALRCALERGEFVLHYQPQIDVRTDSVVGVEALIRWEHPEQGLLFPGSFIPLAEKTGLLPDIGDWVLNEACRQMADWLASGVDVGRVAVNFSAREFADPQAVVRVDAALKAAGIQPHQLEVEITESAAMHNMQAALDTLHALREMGVRVALDDFGTGYSAMSYLQRFPVHTLKIAHEFVRDVHTDPQSAAIATMIADLCSELGLDVVAEGVEHESQLEFLRQNRCWIAQGFLLSRPMPAADIPGAAKLNLSPVA